MEKRMHMCAILASLACAPVALADNDWGVISTGGDRDPVNSFDLANPGPSGSGGSNMVMGFVDGNFNRGMDFDTRDSFYYYVSTDSLNDPGDRGLWYWNNGVNTQLFNTPFNDSGDGDASLNNNFSRFFITTDDGDAAAGDSLYVFDNLGGAVMFTEIGETGLTQLIGIAVDPLSGILYGYDAGTEALYTINQTTGAPSLVGFSGAALGAIGGMDFSADGSTLLMSVAGDLFLVDKTNGLLTAAGDVGLNVSALSYRVPGPGALAQLMVAGLLSRGRRR
jgi:hypothetical protein